MPRPRELSDLVTQGPEAVAPERSEGTTKGLRVTKSLSSSQHLTYLDLREQESHGNTFNHYKCGKAINRFPEQRVNFHETHLATSAKIFMMILTHLQFDQQKTRKSKIKMAAIK